MSLRPSTLPLSALSRSLLPRTPRSPFSPRFSSSTSSSTISPPSAAESALARQIDWPTYLNLRKSSRVYGLIASIPTAIGFFGGASYFATLEMDPTNLILGIQPVFVYGAATIGCVGLGWLAGPVLGSGVWKLVHRRNVKAMEAKDKEFFRHVVKNRADASRNSAMNPIPDYYAEKVGSLTQYRHWLRDQRAFMRKSEHL